MQHMAGDGRHCLDSDGGRQNFNQEFGELGDTLDLRANC